MAQGGRWGGVVRQRAGGIVNQLLSLSFFKAYAEDEEDISGPDIMPPPGR